MKLRIAQVIATIGIAAIAIFTVAIATAPAANTGGHTVTADGVDDGFSWG